MHKKPIESRNTIDIVPDGDFYRVCATCEAIEDLFRKHGSIDNYSINGWKYVKVAEANGYPLYVKDKYNYLAYIQMRELQDGRWCSECGATIWLPTFVRFKNNTIDFSYTFEKDELQVDKIVSVLPGKMNISISSSVHSIGELIVYHQDNHKHFPLVRITDTEHRAIENGVIVAKVLFNLSMTEMTLQLYRDGEVYDEQVSYSIEIDKNLVKDIDSIREEELLYTTTFISEGGLNIEHRKYNGFIFKNRDQIPVISDNIIAKIGEIINGIDEEISFTITQDKENFKVIIIFNGSSSTSSIDSIREEIDKFFMLNSIAIEYRIN